MFYFFFFNDTATTEIYTLSLHDALPISADRGRVGEGGEDGRRGARARKGSRLAVDGLALRRLPRLDRKSTRLNSSHLVISYAVFCLKKKKTKCWLTTSTKLFLLLHCPVY